MNGKYIPFPYKISHLDPVLNESLLQKFKGETRRFVRVGPDEFLFPSKYESAAEKIYNFPVRSDDVWVVTFPRSGTTWTQELVWLICNRLNFQQARTEPLSARFPFLEFNVFADDTRLEEFRIENQGNIDHLGVIENMSTPQYEVLNNVQGRRFIKTHIPLSLLPPNLLTSGAKIVYVARNPKDVAVSYYHLNRLFRTLDFTGDFDSFWDCFENNLVSWGPYWTHIKEGWNQRQNPNVLFLFYEDLSKNIVSCIDRVAEFLDTSLSKDQINEIIDYLDIKNFRNNPAVNFDNLKTVGICRPDGGFIREGKSGGWRGKFSEELAARADKWIQDNLQTTDLRFPE
uniref:Sulfotransferase 1C4 n=1 Tax=Cacopsylla melanoneura TaxID=428564 RepID=A0A8D8Q3C8_9HEMI